MVIGALSMESQIPSCETAMDTVLLLHYLRTLLMVQASALAVADGTAPPPPGSRLPYGRDRDRRECLRCAVEDAQTNIVHS